ncbi:MAG: DUF1788 domain-containing protein [Actinomycetaceae bacterium]|nr:DUF1788 domain-containing protein [Actinomycetaceae bacterium]
MATQLQINDFESRRTALIHRLNDAEFLSNKGLGNEAGIFTFCYDPSLELVARDFFESLSKISRKGRLGASGIKTNLIERNLYDVLLEITEAKRILDRIPAQELRHGSDGLLKKIQRIATPEAFVTAMDWHPHQLGDVLLVTGVGEVYPYIRVHSILNNMQSKFRDVPVVVAYPGTFDGGSLSLFSKLKDGNYYRAFDLI